MFVARCGIGMGRDKDEPNKKHLQQNIKRANEL